MPSPCLMRPARPEMIVSGYEWGHGHPAFLPGKDQQAKGPDPGRVSSRGNQLGTGWVSWLGSKSMDRHKFICRKLEHPLSRVHMALPRLLGGGESGVALLGMIGEG